MARSAGQRVVIDDRSGFIDATPTALGAMALVTERGPIGEARRVENWPEFLRTYGDHVDGYVGTHCAKRALEKGCALYVSRVVHYTDLSDGTTKTSAAAAVNVPDRSSTLGSGRATGTGTFPYRLANGDTLVVAIDGDADATATFAGFARRLTGSTGTHTAVTTGLALVLTVNGVNRSVAFAGTENTALLFAAAINVGIPGVYADVDSGNVRITTDKKGTGAALVVHASSAADVLTSLGLTSGQVGASLGSSNVADIEAVTAAEFESIVEGAVTGCSAGADADGHPYIQSNDTGVGSTVQVQSGSTADDEFGFDNTSHAGSATSAVNTLTFTAESDGTWAHALRLVVDEASGDAATRFRLRVTRASTGETLETFDNLSMTTTDSRYVVSVLRDESLYFRATDLSSVTAAPANRPAAATYTPAGGANGLGSLAYADYLGASATSTGFYAFSNLAEFRLVSAPGVTDHDFHVAGAAWAAALTEVRYVGTIPYAITTVANAKAFRKRVSPYASGTAIDTSYGAMYAGWHRVRHPRTGADLWLPAEGEVYAALGTATKAGGVWLALAGANYAKLSTEVLELRVKPGIDDLEGMRNAGVNPFYRDPDEGHIIEGHTTLQRSASSLDRLNVCLFTDFVSERVRVGNQRQRWEPNDESTWRSMRTRTEKFMRELGAKRGTMERDERGRPRFRVVCDVSNNPPTEISAHRTHIDVFYVPQLTSEEQVIGLVVLPPGTALAA